jgi:FO synthase
VKGELARALAAATQGEPILDEHALALADAPAADLADLCEAAATLRDRVWGRVVTFSPKVFLPLTNLCRNHCDYCSFRRSPGDAGEWTMTPAEVDDGLGRAEAAGCAEALFCLGDKPEGAFGAYRRTLASFGHTSTVDYLVAAGRAALARGLLPHTNAGLLSEADMERLKEVNVSLGLMLENVSDRLCEPGKPHHRAPDKRPDKRLAMLDAAGRLRVPFTTGLLVGIGETPRERVETLLAIRRAHRAHGHVQEVIVQNFRAHPGAPMRDAAEPDDAALAHAIALARLVLDAGVSVQAPPNLSPDGVGLLLGAGVNDLGGISPVTPDYINARHAWPHLDALATECEIRGFTLRPRLPVYDAYLDRLGFVDARLRGAIAHAKARLAGVRRPADLPLGARREREVEVSLP